MRVAVLQGLPVPLPAEAQGMTKCGSMSRRRAQDGAPAVGDDGLVDRLLVLRGKTALA